MSEIQPALTPDEWAEPHKCDGRDIVDCDICFGQHTRHARAALALHGQPFGFTREDVETLEALEELTFCEGYGPQTRSLIAKVRALLPPEVL